MRVDVMIALWKEEKPWTKFEQKIEKNNKKLKKYFI